MSEPPTVIHYVDVGEFYSIYGITTMIVVIMLVWYFVRSNMELSHGSVCDVEEPQDAEGFHGRFRRHPRWHPDWHMPSTYFHPVQLDNPRHLCHAGPGGHQCTLGPPNHLCHAGPNGVPCKLNVAEYMRLAKHPGDMSTREGMFPIEDPSVLAFTPEFDGSYEYSPLVLTEPGTDPDYKLTNGMYGDVPCSIYDLKDVAYKPEWDHTKGMFYPNSRTVFRKVYTPVESLYWDLADIDTEKEV
jgi:hypothetical protein